MLFFGYKPFPPAVTFTKQMLHTMSMHTQILCARADAGNYTGQPEASSPVSSLAAYSLQLVRLA